VSDSSSTFNREMKTDNNCNDAASSSDDDDDTVSQHLSLPVELWSTIIPFLGPQEMLKIAGVCKFMMDYITYEDVVINATVKGIQLKSYLKLMEDQAIYMPSKWRFLHLINRKHCEHCCGSSCSSSSSATMDVTLDYLGLCYCKNCLYQGHSGLYAYITDPYVMNIMIADSRIAVSSGAYVVNILKDNPIMLRGTKERCGPVITIEAMNVILNRIWRTSFFRTMTTNEEMLVKYQLFNMPALGVLWRKNCSNYL